MRALHLVSTMVVCLLIVFSGNSYGAGLTQREPNTTLQLPQTPLQFGYTTTNAFGSLTFTNPLAITAPPGETNRLFVVEQDGWIAVVTNLANPTRSEFLNISGRIVGGIPNDEQGL